KITLSASMEMAQSGSLWDNLFVNAYPRFGRSRSFKQKSKRTALGGGVTADFSETKNHSFCFNGNGAKRFALGGAISIITPQPKKSTKTSFSFPHLFLIIRPRKSI
ncbi:MAG: hypothetical protein ACI3XE_05750, partial [Eubacteriales bacterium]